jgi:hypothetical protein
MVKQFMPLHDKDIMNPFYHSAPRVKWYLVDRTEEIEQTQEWKERKAKSETRVQAAQAVAAKATDLRGCRGKDYDEN